MKMSASYTRSLLRIQSYRGSALAGAPLRAAWRGTTSRCCRRRANTSALVVRANLLKYLSEAAARIFSVPEDENIDWEKTYLPFEGKITIGDRARLDRLVKVVESVKGCTDPSATNFDPAATQDDGSCAYREKGTASEADNLQDYLEGAVERVFGHQFKGDDTEPEFPVNPFTGEISSQREIEKMLYFQQVVKKTIEESETEEVSK